MSDLVFVLDQMGSVSSAHLGTINKIDDRRWIIGDDDIFPIQIELLEDTSNFLIYGTGMRSTGEPVYTPLMSTLFIEGSNGHSLGRYGISPGMFTITVYQIFTWNEEFTVERIAAEITCHRLLTECFLEGVAADEENYGLSLNNSKTDQPILPMRH